MRTKEIIDTLNEKLQGLANDARYWDLRRTYGDYSPEVRRHLEACAKAQGRDPKTGEPLKVPQSFKKLFRF